MSGPTYPWRRAGVLGELEMLPRNYLTISEVSRIFGIQRSTVREWLHPHGSFTVIKLDLPSGRFKYMFRKMELVTLVRAVERKNDDPRHPSYNEGDDE